jgi:hypothetical protein
MLPLLILGIYLVAKGNRKNKIFLFGWLLLAPVAAATARETPHALRSETFIPIYELFAGLGIVLLFEKLMNKKKSFYLSILLSAIVVMFYLFDFLHSYYVHMPEKYSQDWQYGYKQAVLQVESMKDKYDQIIFSPIQGRAYIYVLWYGKYTPQEFWEKGTIKKDAFGFYNVDAFGKYTFASPSSFANLTGKKVLYVGGANEMPKDSRVLKKINYLDGSTSYVVADNLK